MKIDVVSPDRIIELAVAFQGAKTLLSAVELGVFTALADGPLDLETVRKRICINERGARDFLDALVALGTLLRREDGRYANTAESDLYLDRSKPTYVGDMVERLNAWHFGIWASLTAALRTGEPQSGTRGNGNFPALYADQAAAELFVSAMTVRTLPVAKALAAEFPWPDHRTVIDIGCAQGCLPVVIAQAHAHISGGGFDLPHLHPLFDGYVRKHALSDRLQFYPGDFFNDPIPTADVLILGRVLHNWNLATKKMLLKKAYDALPPAGVLIVYERLIDDERRANTTALLSSLNMLLMSAGGFDFTGADCKGWMQDAGFRDIQVEPLTADQSMVIGRKPA